MSLRLGLLVATLVAACQSAPPPRVDPPPPPPVPPPVILTPPADPTGWDVVGLIEIGRPARGLVGAEVVLCPDPGERECAGETFSRTATTQPDGSFQLSGVPEGEFVVHVRIPRDEPECRGLAPFVPPMSISVPRDCGGLGGPRVCTLGDQRVCVERPTLRRRP